jgi:hypothetical protein
MPPSRTRSVGLDGHQDALAGASVAPEHGAEGLALGSIGTRQADSAPRTRTRHAQATHLVLVSAAGPGGSWLSRSLTTKGEGCWGQAPQAYVYLAALRATRDLLRRRLYLMRKWAELLTHVQNTNSQYNPPEIGKKLAYKANRDGVAERFPDPAVQKSIEVDLALLDHDDRLLRAMELTLLKTAKQHDANTLSLRRTVPGIGEILSLVLLYEIHDIERFPRVQDFVSYCRLVKCAKESAGKRYGTSGTKIGNASLTWAFSEAAVLFLRANPTGQKYLMRLEKKHGKGKAFTVLAPKLARAVYSMLKRARAFDRETLLQQEAAERASPTPHWTWRGSAWRVYAGSLRSLRR